MLSRCASWLRAGAASERGQGQLEYSMILSIVSVALIGCLILFRDSLQVYYQAVVSFLAALF